MVDIFSFNIFLTSSKAFRVFNKRTMVVEEYIHVIFEELYEDFEKLSLKNNSLKKIGRAHV